MLELEETQPEYSTYYFKEDKDSYTVRGYEDALSFVRRGINDIINRDFDITAIVKYPKGMKILDEEQPRPVSVEIHTTKELTEAQLQSIKDDILDANVHTEVLIEIQKIIDTNIEG